MDNGIFPDNISVPVPNDNKSPTPFIEEDSPGELTIGWIMSRIDRIAGDTRHIDEMFNIIRQMPPSSPHDYGAANRADALGQAVTSREETNRKTLKLLEKMYDDLKAANGQQEQSRFTKQVKELLGMDELKSDDYAKLPGDLRNMITQKINAALSNDKLLL